MTTPGTPSLHREKESSDDADSVGLRPAVDASRKPRPLRRWVASAFSPTPDVETADERRARRAERRRNFADHRDRVIAARLEALRAAERLDEPSAPAPLEVASVPVGDDPAGDIAAAVSRVLLAEPASSGDVSSEPVDESVGFVDPVGDDPAGDIAAAVTRVLLGSSNTEPDAPDDVVELPHHEIEPVTPAVRGPVAISVMVLGLVGYVASVLLALGAIAVAIGAVDDEPTGLVATLTRGGDLMASFVESVVAFDGSNAVIVETFVSYSVASVIYLLVGMGLQSLARRLSR